MNIDNVMDLEVSGEDSLQKHEFSSKELNGRKYNKSMARAGGGISLLSEGGQSDDSEQKVYYRLNQTGNIFYATTSQQLNKETKDLFDSVAVLFSAMTTALQRNGKTLFDYDSWTTLIGKSKYFAEVQKFAQSVTIKSNQMTVDTQIISQLIPGLVSGSSLQIAKGVLGGLNGEFSSSSKDTSAKIAHILFICEELFGSPSITVRLFYADKTTHEKVTSSPCHTTVSKAFEFRQEANTFLFVSPEKIAKFASTFVENQEAYDELIDNLTEHLNK